MESPLLNRAMLTTSSMFLLLVEAVIRFFTQNLHCGGSGEQSLRHSTLQGRRRVQFIPTLKLNKLAQHS